LAQGDFGMFKYLWLFATNVITVLVIFAMFGRAETPFQTITLSVLAIIYASVLNVGAALLQMNIAQTRDSMADSARLRKLLNDPELNESELLETDNKLVNANSQIFLTYVFSLVIWSVAVWKILGFIL
jgi:hypothetical protein